MIFLRTEHDKQRSQNQAMVHPVGPFQTPQRLAAQQGLFLCPTDVARTFDLNLEQMKGSEEKANVVKIILDGDTEPRREMLNGLLSASIQRSALFPGLDGFARGLATRTPLFAKKRAQLRSGARVPTAFGLGRR
jgi:hypothetical protein